MVYVPSKEKSRRARSGELGGHVIWLSVSVHFRVQFWSSQFQIAVWTWSGVPPCWNSLYLGPFSSKIGVRNSSSMYLGTLYQSQYRRQERTSTGHSTGSCIFTHDVRIAAVPWRRVSYPGRRTVLSSPNGIWPV